MILGPKFFPIERREKRREEKVSRKEFSSFPNEKPFSRSAVEWVINREMLRSLINPFSVANMLTHKV